MLIPALILFLIAAILGVWSASLLWRAWHAWRLQRIVRRKDAPAVPIITPGRRRFGVAVALVVLPFAGVAFSLGEVVRTGNSDTGFDTPRVALVAAIGVLVFMAIGAVFVAIRFDPAHGRRRCRKCWYDMSATTGRRCPECGDEPANEHALFRTRRAPRLLIAAGLMLIGAYSLHAAYGVSRKGWMAAVPTTAMIVALPWLSDKAVEGAEASLARRVWNEDLWGWQEALLRRRCRGMVEGTSDVDRIARAAMLWSSVDEAVGPPRLTVEGQINVLREFEAESTGVMRGISPRIVYVERMFPEMLDPRVTPAATSALLAALRSGRGIHVHAGIRMSASLGDAGGSLAPELALLVENAAVPEWTSMQAQLGLARMSPASEAAWEAYLKTFASPREPIRFHAPRCVSFAAGRDNLRVRDLLLSLLSDPSDRVRVSAAEVIIQSGGSLCEWRSSLSTLGREHPDLMHAIIQRLAQECPAPELVPAIETLLRLDHRGHQDAGINAAASMGASGAPLLPLLRQIEEVEGDAGRSRVIAEAVRAIEEAVRRTPNND